MIAVWLVCCNCDKRARVVVVLPLPVWPTTSRCRFVSSVAVTRPPVCSVINSVMVFPHFIIFPIVAPRLGRASNLIINILIKI